jgi:hypothetical protein
VKGEHCATRRSHACVSVVGDVFPYVKWTQSLGRNLKIWGTTSTTIQPDIEGKRK